MTKWWYCAVCFVASKYHKPLSTSLTFFTFQLSIAFQFDLSNSLNFFTTSLLSIHFDQSHAVSSSAKHATAISFPLYLSLFPSPNPRSSLHIQHISRIVSTSPWQSRSPARVLSRPVIARGSEADAAALCHPRRARFKVCVLHTACNIVTAASIRAPSNCLALCFFHYSARKGERARE